MMTLKHGSFYKDGIKVPIEFGNNEQIQLLKTAEILRNEGTMCLEHFVCLCGWHNDLTEMEFGEKFRCKMCSQKYIFLEDEEWGLPIVKMP